MVFYSSIRHISIHVKGGAPMRQFEFGACGHPIYQQRSEINVQGARAEVTLIRNENGRFSHCHNCFEALCIRCAWCGRIIAPSDAVALCTNREGCRARRDATRYGDYFIGCFAPNCVGDSFTAIGNWVIDERNPSKGRVMTLQERLVV